MVGDLFSFITPNVVMTAFFGVAVGLGVVMQRNRKGRERTSGEKTTGSADPA